MAVGRWPANGTLRPLGFNLHMAAGEFQDETGQRRRIASDILTTPYRCNRLLLDDIVEHVRPMQEKPIANVILRQADAAIDEILHVIYFPGCLKRRIQIAFKQRHLAAQSGQRLAYENSAVEFIPEAGTEIVNRSYRHPVDIATGVEPPAVTPMNLKYRNVSRRGSPACLSQYKSA